MKTRLLIIIGIFLLVFTFTLPSVFADCSLDSDWQEKPCLDMPPYDKSELVQIWDQYYLMKGQKWMEMKKAEMDFAIENQILEKWLSFDIPTSQNFQNHNVYFYYFLNDQVPIVDGYYSEQLLQNEDRNSNLERYAGDQPADNLSTVIVTYYHISNGGLFVLSVIFGVGIIGFVIWRTRK
ncbi:hypothetical protein [Nitrosarchaeum sp. AC2]|uniref:hypothetical protein n=1 Tax=Nitrosarchaeum sp. AC2 TaxID=2259673 RepID=UPI0015CC43C6|nr:hypothetical protein [Nitrosarchaeum sp. AC2]QLH10818.1 hypothetical protein DSQ20_04545 [Nitrosarchaeum sp. AC2]